jgi:hypothetical protein
MDGSIIRKQRMACGSLNMDWKRGVFIIVVMKDSDSEEEDDSADEAEDGGCACDAAVGDE